MNERTIPTLVLLSDLRGLPFSGCGWSMVMRVILIGTIVFLLRNIPPVLASATEATTFLVFGKRLGWDRSVFFGRVIPWWEIADIKMTSNASTGFGKYYVGRIRVTMEDHIACMVADAVISLSCCII